jgi:hypothetical protein
MFWECICAHSLCVGYAFFSISSVCRLYLVPSIHIRFWFSLTLYAHCFCKNIGLNAHLCRILTQLSYASIQNFLFFCVLESRFSSDDLVLRSVCTREARLDPPLYGVLTKPPLRSQLYYHKCKTDIGDSKFIYVCALHNSPIYKWIYYRRSTLW